jgi:hypothetical protein
MANAPVDVKPLFPIFKQQWQTLSFPIHAPCDELHFGRLMRATVVHSDDNIKLGMLRSLPMRPIWVEDPGMMVALAACFRTPTFHWDNTRSVGQLPPHEAFNFILEHYTVFEQLAVPMWMWLAIYVQAVSAEESLLLPSSSPGRLDPQLNWVETLSAISTPNSYNSVPERNKISAWFRRRVVPDALRGAVRQKTMFPAIYNSRYAPVSLATFIAAIQGGWSFDDLYYARIAASFTFTAGPSLSCRYCRTLFIFPSASSDFFVAGRQTPFFAHIFRSCASFFASCSSARLPCPKRLGRGRNLPGWYGFFILRATRAGWRAFHFAHTGRSRFTLSLNFA